MSSQVFGSQARFIMIPSEFIKTDCYKTLGASSKALYIDLCAQYRPPIGNSMGNNGDLTLGFRYMRKNYGWTSPTTLAKAIHELIERKILIVSRPQRFKRDPILYALTTHKIDYCKDEHNRKKHNLTPTAEPLNLWKAWHAEPAENAQSPQDERLPWNEEIEA